jgi:hypothetical protein
VSENSKPKRTLSYWVTHAGTRILELESRCAVIRTVGSNPTLSANNFVIFQIKQKTDFPLMVDQTRARQGGVRVDNEQH